MSHIVSIQTEVRDPVAIRLACDRLKLPEPVIGEVKLFSSSATVRAVSGVAISGGLRCEQRQDCV